MLRARTEPRVEAEQGPVVVVFVPARIEWRIVGVPRPRAVLVKGREIARER